MQSAAGMIVEDPFLIVKRQLGFVRVDYHQLVKNTNQIVMLFALANLWLARKRLQPLMRKVRPRKGKYREKLQEFHGQRLNIACLFVFMKTHDEIV